MNKKKVVNNGRKPTRQGSSFYPYSGEILEETNKMIRIVIILVFLVFYSLQQQLPAYLFGNNCKVCTCSLVRACWKIKDITIALRKKYKAQSAWSVHWVPRRLNQQAHLLAQTHSGRFSPLFPAFLMFLASFRHFILL